MGRSLAFLQARMRSVRLPGKVLFMINGKSILERAIERLRASHTLDGVVVLTTRHTEDDLIVAEAHRLGTEVYRGPDFDVLSRFRQAADIFCPEIIVRATADNPLIDIGSVDRILGVLRAEHLDYCLERNLPIGAATEAITRAALEKVDQLGRLPHHREHVTMYVKEHREEFRTAFPDPPEELRRPELRITVDTPEDFSFVDALIKSIPESGCPVPLQQYMHLMPSLSGIPDPATI